MRLFAFRYFSTGNNQAESATSGHLNIYQVRRIYLVIQSSINVDRLFILTHHSLDHQMEKTDMLREVLFWDILSVLFNQDTQT